VKQAEIVKNLTDRQLLINVYATQFILIIIGLLLMLLLFDHWRDIFIYVSFHPYDIFVLGIGSALLVICIDVFITLIVPKKYLDDGGINQRIFQHLSITHIGLLALTVAIAEEFLFRGIIQTQFGLFIASIVFALVHIRYLASKVMFFLVVALSFYIGFIFEITENLLVTMMTHFIIDFILGVLIKYQLVKM
jgi:uncharacterized protein